MLDIRTLKIYFMLYHIPAGGIRSNGKAKNTSIVDMYDT